MKIVIGSGSDAKKKYFEELFSKYDCEFVLGKEFTDIEPNENGNTSYENALIKARYYSKVSNLPAIALDSSILFLDYDVNDSIQVGAHVKSPKGKELTPLEMREYYKQLAHEHGGKIRSKWIDAYALVDDTYEYCRDFQDIDKQSGFYLTDEVHEKFDPFQPLDSISKNIERNVFFYDYVEYKKNEILIKEDRDQSKYALFVDEVVSEIALQLNLKKH